MCVYIHIYTYIPPLKVSSLKSAGAVNYIYIDIYIHICM